MLEGESEAPPAHEPPPPPLTSIPPVHAQPPAMARSVVIEQDRGLPVELAGLTASAQSYQQASHLEEDVAARLQEIKKRVQRHASLPQLRAGSREISRALALVRTRDSLRSVIMASIILGPPKSLEPS